MRNTTLATLICFLLLATSCQKEEIDYTTDIDTEIRGDFPQEGDGSAPPHEPHPCWDGLPNNLRVLFIGNSFTDNYTVDIPTMFNELAIHNGKSISNVSTSAILGHTLNQHTNNTATLSLINQGDWDVVVLQENSGYLANAPGAGNGFENSVSDLVNLVDVASPKAKVFLYRVVPPVAHTDPSYATLDADWKLLFDDVASNHSNVTTTDVAGAFTMAYTAMGAPGIVGGNDILRLSAAYQHHFTNTGGFMTAVAFYSDIFSNKPCIPQEMTFWVGGSSTAVDFVSNNVHNIDEIVQAGYIAGFSSSVFLFPANCPGSLMYGVGHYPC